MRTYGTLKLAPLGDAPDQQGWVAEVEPQVAMRMKRLFARARWTRAGAIELRATPEVARDLVWIMDRYPFELTDDDRSALDSAAAEHMRVLEVAENILHGRAEPLPVVREPLRPPRDYQTLAADLALHLGRLMIVDDVGLGKTMTGLLMLKAPDALPAVVVCQTHLTSQWLEQLALTWGDLRGHEVRTGMPYDLSTVCDGHPPDVIVVPYSKIANWAGHLRDHVQTVLFDEIQELRRDGTRKYEGSTVLAESARYKVGLTATPIYNYGSEIHTVMEVIAPGALGTASEFAREWTTGHKGRVHSPEALGRYLRDESLMLVRTRADVGREIDEPLRIPQHVDSDPEQFESARGDVTAMARLILSQDTARADRFRASGELDWRLRQATGVAKAPFVAEFVRMLLETEEKVVLFGWHREVYDIWMRELAQFGPLLYTGTESPRKKDEAKRRFLMNSDDREIAMMNGADYDDVFPESRVLIMSLRSGAGVDGLQTVASVAVFGELDWSPKVHDQAIGRLWRDGQTKAVAAFFCVSTEGADPLMAEVNGVKEAQSSAIVHPDADPLTISTVDPADRIKALAHQVLEQNGTRP